VLQWQTEAQGRRGKLMGKSERLAGQRRVFTIDTELDQVMTALKLTLMNLCSV
jgi:hypothetical protein